MRKLILVLMTVMACGWSLMAQTQTYHGTIVDAANNEPLVGATVLPVGGGQGAAADIDGKFTLTVPANVKKAKVSYVGYKEQTVDLKNGMTVYMSSTSTNLDDLVVVAYGTANKESLTGSVAVVGAQEIEDRPVTSVTAALEGNAPGVQVNNSVGTPGSSPTIRIRGFNSFTTAQNPLYVVDGVPYEGAIADLNPADIESMSVLKDAASCALYGNRGANGVILITTKKAKNVGKVDVTLQVRQGMYNRGLPFYDRLDANTWMEQSLKARANGLVSVGEAPNYQEALLLASESFISNFVKENIYGVPDNELFDAEGNLIPTSYLPGYANDLDWWKAVSRNGYRQEYNVNAAAATEKYNIFASVGYMKENGYMLQTDFERFNGRINANFQPVSYFRFGVNLAATAQESMTGNVSSNELNTIGNPFLTMFTAPVYPYYAHSEDGSVRYEDGEPVWNSAGYLQNSNVAWEMRLNDSNYSATVLDGSIYGTAIIPYGFELTVRGNMHRDKTNSFDYMNNRIGSGKAANGSITEEFDDFRTHTFMQQLNWSHDYGNHHVDVLLDHENWQYSTKYSYVQKSNQLFESPIALSNFEDLLNAEEGLTELRTESYLGRARYNYDQKYFAEVSYRRDGTSRFAKENHWGDFWSVGASWIITKEKFMRNLNWLNYLKLRAAYGSVGNDAAAGAYASYSTYIYNTFNDKITLIPGTLAANNVRWEATKTLDVALEGSLFDDRFTFSVGYFDKVNSDLLYNVTLPLSAGQVLVSQTYGYNPRVLTNIGSMANRGWELQFGVDIIRNSEFKWNFNIDATFMKNKIRHLPDGRDIPASALFQGKSIYEQYTYTWAGVDRLTGNSLYLMDPSSPDYWTYDENGNHDTKQEAALYAADLADAEANGALVTIGGKNYTTNTTYAGRMLQGTSLPTVYGSFGTNLSWKGINLGLLFTYNLGGKTMDSNYQSLMGISTSSAAALHKDVLKSWSGAPIETNPDAPGFSQAAYDALANSADRIDPNGIPQLNDQNSQNNNASSSRFLTSNNYLTLKNINITYDFPRQWSNALKLQNINIGFSCDNLFIVTARKGMNPQYSFSGGQGAYYVPARVFSFQLGVKF